jgi:hypothetical protein
MTPQPCQALPRSLFAPHSSAPSPTSLTLGESKGSLIPGSFLYLHIQADWGHCGIINACRSIEFTTSAP